ncbi:hypothetical protein TTHERM_00046820 (macronuclear) [Tetrahymena thermophila SB210]|uniref:Uncharacterized protein n=1 Tax=Tetrahymena thermophila (strain SB210) TaxID=312017 RepID=Q23DK9_TETTS|nr:hypothetical protein TTHERM_00046820 [Tetrahymena thermophila SB210]EAR94603.2 hypothetical protein TTHERM_00046820 [Tetrahymena thermophila SB210]|eukprot:XP_001014677.2 hypothetical protein TTHERM_00046820 [Tetrahymena thermophila SB210]
MKRFLIMKIKEYQKYLSQDLPILDSNGDNTAIINFDFNENSNEFLENYDKIEQEYQLGHKNNDLELKETSLLKSKFGSKLNLSNQENKLMDAMKLSDSDIEGFLEIISNNSTFKGELIFSDHRLTNQTSIRIAKILEKNSPFITGISLNDIEGFSYICGQNIGEAIKKNKTLRKLHLHNAKLGTKGANRVIEGLKSNKYIEDYDLGQLTNESLSYLVKFISQEHIVQNLSFSEDLAEPWKENTKHEFLRALRDNSYNKQLQSIDIYSERLEENQTFIAEIAILCQHNRRAMITQKNNEYKSKELNTSHSEYYDGDNHAKNAFQFSVKTYMSNVIETLLDEGLYYLEKERSNITRDEKIFEINKQHVNKEILDDIFKADGSLLVLARYMINKIEKNKELSGE